MFNDRESYLAWRTAWRTRYSMTSNAIRDTKKQMKKAYAEQNFSEASNLQRQLHYLRQAANTQMATREEANELHKKYLAKAKIEKMLRVA